MENKRKLAKNEPVYPEERKEQAWTAMMQKIFPEQKNCEGCICYGNWRKFVKECKGLYGKIYVNNGKKYEFFGLVHDDEDYYYGMYSKKHGLVLLSCCGDLKSWGFDIYDEE